MDILSAHGKNTNVEPEIEKLFVIEIVLDLMERSVSRWSSIAELVIVNETRVLASWLKLEQSLCLTIRIFAMGQK